MKLTPQISTATRGIEGNFHLHTETYALTTRGKEGNVRPLIETYPIKSLKKVTFTFTIKLTSQLSTDNKRNRKNFRLHNKTTTQMSTDNKRNRR